MSKTINRLLASVIAMIIVFLVFTIPLALISLSSCVHWNSGDKTYSGYIYSVTKSLGETTAHLRFSEYAGEDSQPSFCIAEEDIETVRGLAGSGKKVKVFIPADFAIALPWACPIPAQIEIMEEE